MDSRLCLLQACEAQGPGVQCSCPVCREQICGCIRALNVNLTLWNVIRIVYPNGKSEADEEAAFQCAKNSFELHQQLRRLMLPPASESADAVNDNRDAWGNNQDRRQLRVEISDHEEAMALLASDSDTFASDNDDDGDDNTSPWVVRVENLEADELRIRRNVVVDQDDINTDGNPTMRNAFGIVEFPSVLEAYADGQDCQIALLQLEEQTEGFPVFMAESGDDDRLVFPQYFSDVRLTVSPMDDPGQPVLVRTVSASHGMVEFRNLRLHVPPGHYLFRMEDMERELFIEIRTHIADGGRPDAPRNASPHRMPHRPRHDVWRLADSGMHRPQALTLHRHGSDEFSDDEIMYESANEYDSDDSFLASEDEDSRRRQRQRSLESVYSDEDGSDGEHVPVEPAAQDDVDAPMHEQEDEHDDEDDHDPIVVRAPASRKRSRRQVTSSEEEDDEDMPLNRLAFKRRQRAIANEDEDSDDI
ncbi:hypothetical protein DYB32_002093 [Aphanomyces invadans]|uniref:Uncharacterized protein n=1 Tax=Aphanomyces invadans TaxID=157072 RepID=A0A3R6Z3S6_9STRA|nr:hypothetical protein DYB32_002093 [Aphanomyces invadans]